MKLIAAFLLTMSASALAEAPQCINIGTRSEGWLFPGNNLKFANCESKIVFCGAKGTRSEGWYALNPDTLTTELLGWEECSSK